MKKKGFTKKIVVTIDVSIPDSDHTKVDVLNLSFRDFRFLAIILNDYVGRYGIECQEDVLGIFATNIANEFSSCVEQTWKQLIDVKRGDFNV